MAKNKRQRRPKKVCPIHGGRLDRTTTQYGYRWGCSVEGCTVVCWGGHTSSPADYETRQARHRCHELFDPIWQDEQGPFSRGHRPNKRGVRRHRAYRWLADQMGLDINDTHFGLFTLEQCERAIATIKSLEICHDTV